MERHKNTFLNIELLNQFQKIINEHQNIFAHDDVLSKKYNLICVFIDRIRTATEFLNEQIVPFEAETDFINFMVYASMIYDGINKLSENFYGKKPELVERTKLSMSVHEYGRKFFDGENCPTDYVFFEYLRAMAFAHPFCVNKRGRKFMQDSEIRYSPWVFKNFNSLDGICVGIRVYTSLNNKISDMLIPFDELKEFLSEVYGLLEDCSKWAVNEIASKNDEWKKTKVNRNQDDVTILREIKNILESRFEETYDIDCAIKYLTCKISNPANVNNVNIFKKAISSKIPLFCDCVDNLDYEKLADEISIIYDRPNKMHQMANYQLEKIFSYLDERSSYIDPFSNEAWGLKQAEDFSKQFAKKWVQIDIDNDSYDEIKLLVRVACYLEKQEQDKGGGK